jgi:hypothetical protein
MLLAHKIELAHCNYNMVEHCIVYIKMFNSASDF